MAQKSWPLLNIHIFRRSVLWGDGKVAQAPERHKKTNLALKGFKSSAKTLYFLSLPRLLSAHFDQNTHVSHPAQGGMRRLDSHLKWRGVAFLPSLPSFSLALPSLNYANALDVWSCLRHSVLLVVLLRYWVPLQWMHTTVHSTKSPPKGWKEFKALKRQKGLSWDFLCTLKRRIKYKFPIGACYGSGTHIKALCPDIKAAWNFSLRAICHEETGII